MINLYWIASIWRQNEQKWWVTSQNIQNYAKLRKWSNYNELHRFDVKTIYNDELRRKTFKTQNYESDQIIMNCIDLTSNDQNVELRRKPFKTTLNYKSDQLILNCIDLTSKRAKMFSYSHRFKLPKWSKRFKTTQNVELRRKPWNYKSDQLILNCIDLTSKRSKMLSYVAKHSFAKLRK